MTTLRCIVTSRAERDLEEHAEFLAATSLDVALRFYDAAESCFRYVTLHPDCGSVVASSLPTLTGLRVRRIPEFPKHLVFFFADKPTRSSSCVSYTVRRTGTDSSKRRTLYNAP